MADPSKIIRSNNFAWPAVPRKEYKGGTTGFKGVSRFVLSGEADDERGLNFQTRYFEVRQGGYSTLERHRHPHTVVVVRGSGSMILGNRYEKLESFDAVYISSGTVHQFHADKGETLGFICVVDRYRDRPEIPADEKDLENWLPDPEVRKRARI